jgi:hypothetical protein
MMKTFSAAFIVCLICFFATVTFADQYVGNPAPIPPGAIAAWRAAARAISNGNYVDPYCHRSSLNGNVRIECHGPTMHYNIHVTGDGTVATSSYIEDKTSPYYQRPEIHGRISQNGSSNQPLAGSRNGADIPGEGEPHYHRDLNTVSLCPPPHFRMTERDGCQPVR